MAGRFDTARLSIRHQLWGLFGLFLLTGALVMLFLINTTLTLAILPVLPIALILFMAFGMLSQPMFVLVVSAG